MVEVRVEAGASFIQELPAADNGFLYVLSGTGRFGSGGTPVRAGQVAHLTPGTPGSAPTQLTVAATEALRFLLWSGPPLHEPVVAYGPFVMNTREQIAQAFTDYRDGKFGPIPAA
jgi:quercetin 2,3-dioxygenase